MSALCSQIKATSHDRTTSESDSKQQTFASTLHQPAAMCNCICKCVAECVLGWINAAVALIGLLILGLGVFSTWFLPVLQPLVEGVLQFVTSLGLAVDMGQSKLIIDSLVAAAKPIGLFLVLFGVLILVVALFGFCATCCKSVKVMAVYAAILGAVSLGSLASTVLYATNQAIIVKPLASILSEQNSRAYQDPFRAETLSGNVNISIYSIATSYLMLNLKCCGIEQAREFQTSVLWNRTYVKPFGSTFAFFYAQVPTACCQIDVAKLKQQLPFEDTVFQCMENPTTSNISYVAHNCVDRLTDQPLFSAVLVALLAILAVLVAAFASSVYLACQYDKRRRNSVYPTDNPMEMRDFVFLTDRRIYK